MLTACNIRIVHFKWCLQAWDVGAHLIIDKLALVLLANDISITHSQSLHCCMLSLHLSDDPSHSDKGRVVRHMLQASCLHHVVHDHLDTVPVDCWIMILQRSMMHFFCEHIATSCSLYQATHRHYSHDGYKVPDQQNLELHRKSGCHSKGCSFIYIGKEL